MTDTDIRLLETGGDDVIAVLLNQHVMLRAVFTEIMEADPAGRREPFDRLRALLAMHEAAEEIVLRPSTRSIGADEVARARSEEEAHASERLAELEAMGCDDPRFTEELARFYQVLLTHAQAEETSEFPRITHEVPSEARADMGRRLLAVEGTGPVRAASAGGAEPGGWAIGAFDSMKDQVKQALDRT